MVSNKHLLRFKKINKIFLFLLSVIVFFAGVSGSHAELVASNNFTIIGQSLCSGGLDGFIDDRGVVWVIYQGRFDTNSGSDVILVQSFDNGATWTNPRNLTFEANKWEEGQTIFQDNNSSRIYLFWAQLGVGDWFPSDGKEGIKYKYSDDYGATWSESYSIINQTDSFENLLDGIKDKDNNFWVAWTDYKNNSSIIKVTNSTDGLNWSVGIDISVENGSFPYLYQKDSSMLLFYTVNSLEMGYKTYNGSWSNYQMIDYANATGTFATSVVEINGNDMAFYYKQLDAGKVYATLKLYYSEIGGEPVQILNDTYDQDSNPFALKIDEGTLLVTWTSNSFGDTNSGESNVITSIYRVSSDYYFNDTNTTNNTNMVEPIVTQQISFSTSGSGGGSYYQKPKVGILVNSIDSMYSADFLGFIKNQKFDVMVCSAGDFNKCKDRKFIVILGGPKAPEGVGDIVTDVLTSDEITSIKQDKAHMITLTNVWSKGQVVHILAGSDRYNTAKSSFSEKDKARDSIK